jgi:hypothetical protein
MRLVDDSTCPDSLASPGAPRSAFAPASRAEAAPPGSLGGCTREELQHCFLVALVPGSVQVVATFDFH